MYKRTFRELKTGEAFFLMIDLMGGVTKRCTKVSNHRYRDHRGIHTLLFNREIFGPLTIHKELNTL